MAATPRTVRVNRAPILTLWAAVVAETLGHDRETALAIGKTLAGLNAQSKGRSLGIYGESDGDGKGKEDAAKPRRAAKTVALMGRKLSMAAVKGEDAEAIERSLERKLGDALPTVRAAMVRLAKSLPAEELAERAYGLYERFRPSVPEGQKGWGAKGELSIAAIGASAKVAKVTPKSKSKSKSITGKAMTKVKSITVKATTKVKVKSKSKP